MIIVTGGAGFIGSNLIGALNRQGESDILVIDHLENGRKMSNLADLDIADYVDRDDFAARLEGGHDWGPIEMVFHLGACSTTTEWNGKYVMRNNFEYSKHLFQWCLLRTIPFTYASSASVYGSGREGFREDRSCERPLNVYAYSKFLFDVYVRKHLSRATSQVVGLRYFNVYGPREAHKGSMASTALQFHQQVVSQGSARVFSGTDGFAAGEQRRDFVYVDDCVRVNLWFRENPDKSGIFNCGTGRAQTFNELAGAVVAWHERGEIAYVPFPDSLRGAYQSHTEADLSNLRRAGFPHPFLPVEQGVARYLDWIATQS